MKQMMQDRLLCWKGNYCHPFDLGPSPFSIASRMAKQSTRRSMSCLWRT
ncbi:hypothetical protein NC651_031008 [Populus alba x Populus x berolinensis]|nr:hypothetical protein NC651_031008 [Populus alba x Populus x berolinensis]